DDLNQKFLTSLAPEWLMHTKVWRNRGDLDTMSLDDLDNHLKVYESEVQKKSKLNSQNMAFISSGKHSSGNKDGNTACVSTASTNVPTASASVATISQDTACTYIASQSSGSQIKFKDINQIDEDDIEEMDIKWNMALLSMREDNCHKMGHFARECRAPRSQERGRRDNYRLGSKAEEQALKALMAIDRVGWDWSYIENNEEDHALVADEVAPTEFALMANTSAESKVFDNSLCSKDSLAQVESILVEYKEREVKYCEKIRTLECMNESNNECIEILKKKLETLKEEKEGVDGKLVGLLTASKDLDNLIKSQRPSPTVESTSGDDQNRNLFVSETVASPITPKPFIKFVKPKDSQSKSKTGKTESPKKPPVKYAEQYRKQNKKPNVRGNQRNWNNLKSHQLGLDFVMKKKACFNCGDFNHLAYDCRKMVKKSYTPKPVVHRPYRHSQRPVRTNMNGARPNRTSFNKQAHSYANRPFHRTSAVRSHYKAPWVPTVNRSFPPVNRKLSTGSRNFFTANRKFPTASRKFPTGSTKCSIADMEMKGKAVKPLACWFWKPSQNLSNKGPNNNSVSVMFKKYMYIDTQGRLKHMTGNISYLSDYEPFNGGYMSFGQGGCKITRQGTIKIGKLKFENVYFVKDLKYNLFSVSQICDNKNSVLLTDSESEKKMMKKSSSSENEPCCSKDCKKNTETLNKKITDLSDKLLDAKNLIYHYKLALAQVKSRLVEYKEREVKYCEKIRTPEFHNEPHNEYIEILKKKLKTLKEEKEGVDGKLACLLKASKDLDNLIEKCADDTVTDYSRPSPTVESTSGDDQNRNSSASKNGESTDSMLSKPAVKFVKAAERKKGEKGTSRSQNKTHESFKPRPVVHRPFRPPVRPMRSNINSLQPNRTTFNKQVHANRPFQRISAIRSQYRAPWVPTINRNFPPVNRKFFPGSRNFPTANRKFPTASRKFPTGSTKCFTADMGMKGKAEKPSACWFWKPSQNLSNKGPNNNSVSVMFKKYTYIDTQGRLKTPRQHNMYSIDLNNIVPHRDLTCLVAKAFADEPKKISDALQDPSWVEAMQEELLQFKIQNVWTLVDCPKGMDVKSAFLYGTIDEEVYVTQPPGFQDSKSPAKVYKVEKAMYGLHQAPRAWYGTLSKYLLKNGFQRGTIDQTLFIRRQREDFILVQVYVDDIIFGSSNPQLCREFEALMREKFQMNAMGDILKKFRYSEVRSSNTPMDKENPWGKYGTVKDVDLHLYRSMIGSLMYLTASRLDIMFAEPLSIGGVLRILMISLRLIPLVSKGCIWCAVTSGCLTIDARLHTAKTLDLVWIWLGSDYGNVFLMGFNGIQCNTIMARLQLCDYHNMVATLEKSEHNIDFHPMVDFIEASPLRIETTEEGTQILATVDGIHRTVTESSLRRNLKLQDEEGISSLPDTRTRIAQSSVLLTVADKPASPLRDVSQGEACPTDSGFIADQDRVTIDKSSTLPHDSAPRVTSPVADEGSMQQTIPELTTLCTSLQRQLSELTAKFQAHEEMATVLTSMDAAIVLASGVVNVPTGSGSIPTASTPTEEQVPTCSDVVPNTSLVFATITVVTSNRRRKGKEVMVGSETPKKQKVQEQIDAQVARELEEQLEREDQRRSAQIARDAEIARIHAEEELQIMTDSLDRNNETVAKYLQEYHQFASELPIERRIELITDLVKYQDNYAKIYKYQSQQRKPMTKKQKRDYYMSVIKNNLGWKVKDFRGMTFEEVEAKLNSVWKQMEDFIPVGSKEETERIKRKGLNLEKESAKKQKTSEEVPKEAMSPEEVPEEKVKEMMQLVPIEEVYVEALQIKHPIIDWKNGSFMTLVECIM
nr:hypothetical protein [Tanacetum cinerariifolium]